MPLLTRRSLLTYKTESTYGTAATSTYTALEVVRDPDISPLVVDRLPSETLRSWFGNDRQRLINRRVTISFDIYMSGSGTAGTAPAFGDFLVACGCTEAVSASTSVTYTLASLSGTITSVTFRWYADGTLHQVTGARGTWTITANAGSFPVLRIEATGLYTQPTDSALISATFSNQAAPFEVSAGNTPTVSINSVSNCMSEFELALNNEVVYESFAGCSNRVVLRDRAPEGSIQIESKLLTGGTGQNFYTLFEGGTLVPITFTHSGGGAGNTFALTMSNCQLMEPTLATVNQMQFMTIPFMPITTDGTSEISLVFT